MSSANIISYLEIALCAIATVATRRQEIRRALARTPIRRRQSRHSVH